VRSVEPTISVSGKNNFKCAKTIFYRNCSLVIFLMLKLMLLYVILSEVKLQNVLQIHFLGMIIFFGQNVAAPRFFYPENNTYD